MNYQGKMVVSESEKNTIKEMYGIVPEKRNFVFEACTTVDGRYFVIHDEVFDIQEQKTIGNLWNSIDTFKTIFENIKIDHEEYIEIRESILSIPILESHENLHGLRDILLEFNFFQDTWVGRTVSHAGASIEKAAEESWVGLKKFGVAISKGEWTQILTLLSKGVRFVLRKLKDAMYSTVGMIVDSILIATGIGKTVQWVPWALITALDAYQLISNDWPTDEKNDPTWLKLLFFGFDILGLVSAGAMAKAARMEAQPLKSISKDPKKVIEYLRKNPKLKSIIESIISMAKKVPEYLSKASSFIGKKFPAGASFIQSVLGGISKILTNLENSLGKLIGKTASKGTMVGSKTTGLMYGIETGTQKIFNPSGLSPEVLKRYDNVVQTTYKGKDPFD